jgi:FkbH-like protein
MRTSEFLFPDALNVGALKAGRLLIIGSCMAELYSQQLQRFEQGLECDVLLINNASALPPAPPRPIRDYAAQLIILPLRTILTDAVLVAENFLKPKFSESLMSSATDRMARLLEPSMAYAKNHQMVTLVANFIVPQGHTLISLAQGNELAELVKRLNSRLFQDVKRFPNTFLLDVESISASIGKRYFLGDFIEFSTHNTPFFADWAAHEMAPYWTHPQKGRIEDLPDLGSVYENKLDEFIECIYGAILNTLRVLNQIHPVKLVIFDLDNTLWRGLIGEHYGREARSPYVDGWPIGVWEAVQTLRARGVLIAIVSKNDLHTVQSLWYSAIPIPILHLKDFTTVRINWNPKPDNIAEILDELSLTPESVLFIDDNPIEREAVLQAFPKMRVAGSNPFLTRRILMWAPELQIGQVTKTSKNRANLIKARIERVSYAKKTSHKDFLKTLNLKVSISTLSPQNDVHFSRCLELLNKTNQFNTTGERWTIAEFSQHLATGGLTYYFSVGDRFADHGIVGVVIVKDGLVSQFAMSCRVIGLEVEYAVLESVVKRMRQQAFEPIHARLIFTDLNTPCREFYRTAGFTDSPTDSERLVLAQNAEIKYPQGIQVTAGKFRFLSKLGQFLQGL